ncbi:MAG: sporulation protein YqfD [Eubacterium sp.]|nr:sporulation protein YqfD [Eubacterium sp.]
MVRFFRWLLGYVKFSFSGGFIDGFVNTCYQNKINVHNLKNKKGTLYGECLARDYRLLHIPARENGGKIRVLKKRGLIFLLMKIRNRWGLFVGALIFVCIVSFLSGFIWNVEIIGNDRISTAEISAFLDENNLKRGANWKSVDKDKIENLMMASFDDCAWVHINELNTTARVEINETVKKPKITSKKPANLKAKKDGLIVKASVTNGWQVAKVGDSVTEGDLLISGIYDSETKKGNQFAHASGEYIAEVKEKLNMIVSRKQSYKAYKEERTFKKLSFFGLEIPLYLSPYQKQNSELTYQSDYLILNSNELPIGIETIKERRYELKTKTLSDSELNSLVKAEIEKKLSEDFSDCEIIKKKIDVSLGADEAVVKGELLCLENIGKEVKIKIKNK